MIGKNRLGFLRILLCSVVMVGLLLSGCRPGNRTGQNQTTDANQKGAPPEAGGEPAAAGKNGGSTEANSDSTAGRIEGLTDDEGTVQPVIRITPKEELPGEAENQGASNLEPGEAENQPVSDLANRENLQAENEINMEKAFYISEITDEIFARMKGKSFKADCTLPREDLRYLHVLHKNLNGETLEGELVVNVHIADTVLDLMRKLYEADYPIEKIRLVDEYDADDERSMADNNSSAFNYRVVSGTTTISTHGLGMAIDINPLYNPYITTRNGEQHVEPANGVPYVDRSGDYDYKIDREDLAYKLFCEAGFEWGGAWKNSKDYQHFQIPRSVIDQWYK